MEDLQLWVCVWGTGEGASTLGGDSHLHFLGAWILPDSLHMGPLSQLWGRQSDLAWWAGPPCELQLLPHPTTKRLIPTTGNT